MRREPCGSRLEVPRRPALLAASARLGASQAGGRTPRSPARRRRTSPWPRLVAAVIGLLLIGGAAVPAFAAGPTSPAALVSAYLSDLLVKPYRPAAALAMVLPSSLPPGVSASGGVPFIAGEPPPQRSPSAAYRACSAAARAATAPLAAKTYTAWTARVAFKEGGVRETSRSAAVSVAFTQPNLDPATMTSAERAAVTRTLEATIKHPSALGGKALVAAIDHVKTACAALGPSSAFGLVFGTVIEMAILISLYVVMRGVGDFAGSHQTISLDLVRTTAGWRIRLPKEALVPGLLLLDARSFTAWMKVAGTGLAPSPTAGRSGASA